MKLRFLAVAALTLACSAAQPAAPVAPAEARATPATAKAPEPIPAPAPEARVSDACTFSGDTQDKYRWDVKHRRPATVAPKEATLETLLAWPPPAGSDDVNVRTRDDPSALLDPHEGEVFVVTLDLWLAKIEKNDCDWHLELAAPGAGPDSPRVIAEVSQGPEFTAARSEVAQLVGASEIRSQCRKFSAPARVRLTGYGFWDGAHWTRKDPRVGHAHGSKLVGTLWELHPVWKVEVLAPGATTSCR